MPDRGDAMDLGDVGEACPAVLETEEGSSGKFFGSSPEDSLKLPAGATAIEAAASVRGKLKPKEEGATANIEAEEPRG